MSHALSTLEAHWLCVSKWTLPLRPGAGPLTLTNTLSSTESRSNITYVWRLFYLNIVIVLCQYLLCRQLSLVFPLPPTMKLPLLLEGHWVSSTEPWRAHSCTHCYTHSCTYCCTQSCTYCYTHCCTQFCTLLNTFLYTLLCILLYTLLYTILYLLLYTLLYTPL